jgi:hypothetical protein
LENPPPEEITPGKLIFLILWKKGTDAQKQSKTLRANFSHAQGKSNSWTKNLIDFLF